jgi:glycosyltransferase involved in cell wall biosynthesis
MKIGVDIRSLMDKEYSGVSWYTLDLLTEILRQDKVNEYFLYYNSGHDIASRISDIVIRNSDKIKIIATRYPNKIFNYFLQKIFHWPKLDRISYLAEKIPSIKRGGYAAETGCVNTFWSPHFNFSSFSKNCKVILTVHDLSFLVYPDFFSARKNFWHKMLGAKKLIARADKIIAISENTKNDLIKLANVPAGKIEVVYSGVGAEFQPLDATGDDLKKIKAKYSLPDKFILNIGTIEPRKNITGLIKAFDKIANAQGLKDYFLIIVGAVGWKNKEVYQAINSAKNKERIKMIGYIEKSERVYFYNLAKIFCYPSFYEGFGLPILEAMASGVPVITSNVSAIPEVAGDAALLIDPNDENSLAQAMLSIVQDEKLREAYSARGLECAKLFSWEKSAEKYLEVITSLLSS